MSSYDCFDPLEKSYPVKRISRPSRHLYFGFVYTPACKTDIRKTWEKYGYVSPKREAQKQIDTDHIQWEKVKGA